MPTRSDLYKAPFAPGAPDAIDARMAEKLLSIALSGGGDYADLFFEYRAAGGLSFDEGILEERVARRIDGVGRARHEG